MVKRHLIPLAGRGLDATPFNGKAERAVPILSGAIEIFPPALAGPPVTGLPRTPALRDAVRLLFPVRPIAADVIALHLIGGGGGAQEEGAREVVGGFSHWFGTSN